MMSSTGAGTSVPSKPNGAGTSVPLMSDKNGTKVPTPKGYKETKVGVIPEEWKICRTDRVLERIRKKVIVDISEKYQQIGIRSHAKGIFHKELVTGQDLGNKAVFWIEENCFIVNIVFAWEQAVAKTTHREKGMIASHRFPMYQPKDNRCDIDYILYFFKSKRGKYSLGLASPGGAGRNKTLGQGEFSELKIPLPPLKEQQKIAQILTTWDSAITTQKSIIQSKEKLKKGLMQKLLSGEVRFGGFFGVWEEVKLGDIATFHKGKGISKKDISNDGIKCIRYGELYTKYNEKIENIISKTNVPKEQLFLSKINDILIPASGETAIDLATASCVLKKDIGLGGDINIIRSELNGIFLSYYLNVVAKTKIASLAQGISVIHLYSSQLKSLKIKLPSLQEQQKIAKVLTNADKEIDLLKNELQELKEQKRGLMQKLLTGVVRVNYE